jgi:hypothetical protein
MKLHRITALFLLSLAFTGCSLAGVGDLFKGIMNPGVAVPGNEWVLKDAFVVSAPESVLRSDAPPGVFVAEGEPECTLQVCTTVEACMGYFSALIEGGQVSTESASRPAGVVAVVFPVDTSGGGDGILYNLCKKARLGQKFNHLDGHFDMTDRRVVDDANRGAR